MAIVAMNALQRLGVFPQGYRRAKPEASSKKRLDLLEQQYSASWLRNSEQKTRSNLLNLE
jgi:hypothetical protein